ncbi:MAG: RNA polymerase sigma factor RpoH [Betaproteobacteria bacterium]|jgi:RNA polymerase sigma-32 factor|nr:MAG: RNA polymerase sigma factor RpoH [Betaproteobacteria bacterium]
MSQALATLSLPSVASLDNYIQAVNRIPLLSQEEETTLATRFQEQQDLAAARSLVLSHLRLVVAIARGYRGYGLAYADLIQEGNVGLMKAVKRFDPTRGVRLVSFAMHWIRAEIHEFVLRNWRIVKVATTKAQRKLFFNLRSMKPGFEALGADEIKAVANQLNVRPEDVVEMETRMGGHDVALDPLTEDEEESNFAPISYLTNSDDDPGRILEHEDGMRSRSEGLAQALATLDARSRRIIESRWLREEHPLTLHQLADEFGISAERVRQVEAQAMKKMRLLLAPQDG